MTLSIIKIPPPGTASCCCPSFSSHVGSTFQTSCPQSHLPHHASASSAYPTHTTFTMLNLLSQMATFSSTQAILPSLVQIASLTTPSPDSMPAHTPTNFTLLVNAAAMSGPRDDQIKGPIVVEI